MSRPAGIKRHHAQYSRYVFCDGSAGLLLFTKTDQRFRVIDVPASITEPPITLAELSDESEAKEFFYSFIDSKESILS